MSTGREYTRVEWGKVKQQWQKQRGKERKQKQVVMEQPRYVRSTINLHLANAREVGPWSRDLQRVWFGGGGEKGLFSVSSQGLFWEILC